MKYLILGAGPAGLSFASRLLQKGEKDFLVVEKESEAGGLCRSATVDGYPLDIGGGHFLDVKRKRVLDFLFDFMPREEWGAFDRISKIVVNGQTIGSPIEANIWQLNEATQRAYLADIASAGCNTGEPMPKRFVDWIYWKLGRRIAEDYMLPYNKKMFGEDLNQLGTYWLEKLPNVSYQETLESCMRKKAFGQQPAHAKFLYPKAHGYGEVWRRMAEKLGCRIKYGVDVSEIDCDTRVVNGEYSADVVIVTIPWTAIKKIRGIDDVGQDTVSGLKHTGIAVNYSEQNLDTDAQWIYYPDPALAYHRVLVRHNFCPGSSGHWTETNTRRIKLMKDSGGFEHINPYAYPLNTIGKNEMMSTFIDSLRGKAILGLGRWGEWQHLNSDVVVDRALGLAESVIEGAR